MERLTKTIKAVNYKLQIKWRSTLFSLQHASEMFNHLFLECIGLSLVEDY